MKANEFVREFGWDGEKKFIGWYGGDTAFKFIKVKVKTISVHSGDQPYDFHINDLKCLVDSWELVQVGLPELKKSMFSDSKDLEYVKNWVLTVSEKLLTEKGIKLKQAILDVESCQ
jgi:hypothetical protein